MELKEALIEIYKNLKERLGIEKDPKLILKNDEENSKNIWYDLSKSFTAFKALTYLIRGFSFKVFFKASKISGGAGYFSSIKNLISFLICSLSCFIIKIFQK